MKSVTIPSPVSQQGRALIKIRRVGICGTDIHAFAGTQPYFNYPRILGHELAGELIDANGASGFKDGEIVTVLPYLNCGNCVACRSGKPNCCVHMQVCGVHIDGGMVEYLAVPASSVIHGNGLSLDELALVEPLAIAAHAVRRAQIQQGEFALVVGAGPIGLGIMQLCMLAGAKVIAIDIDEQRLAFCRRIVRPHAAINASNVDAVAEVKSLTNNDMATAVFDATGSLAAINHALAYLAHGGRYVLVGLQKGDFSFNHPEFHKRESTLMSSRNALKEDFEYVISCIRKKLLDPTALITHRLSFKGLESEFRNLVEAKELVVKGMIEIGKSAGNQNVL